MKEQRIMVEIDAEGRMTADAEGFSGDACLKELEKLMGGIASDWKEVEREPEAREARISRVSRTTLTQGRKQ